MSFSSLIAWLTFAAALVAAAAVALGGAITLPGLWIDAPAAALLLLVTFVGAIVTGFSRRYLDGNPGRARFERGLLLTLGCVIALVAAGHLVVFALAWIGTSLALHRLLVFNADRPAAQRAARKKFVLGRIADLALVVAFVLLAGDAGSGRIDVVLAHARTFAAQGAGWPHGGWIAGLMAFAALVKCAQFPFHAWLPEVMEAPTPVSALLHAGIINAGGVLVIRFAPVMAGSPGALAALVLAGTFTALLAAAVTPTQTSVKVALAWSTAAQMGFMLMQCGLGAYPAALLHLIAHSLYKARLFLASGTLPARARPAAVPPSRRGIALFALIGIGATALVAAPPASAAALPAGTLALALVFASGLATIGLHRGAAGAGVGSGLAWRAAGLAVLYVAGSLVAHRWFGPSLAIDPAAGAPAGTLLPALVVAAFALGAAGAAFGPSLASRPAAIAWRVHLANGLYVSAWLDRLLQRFTPRRAA
jgi:NAD(P)H-quinone oxidoreductase subunit 5